MNLPRNLPTNLALSLAVNLALNSAMNSPMNSARNLPMNLALNLAVNLPLSLAMNSPLDLPLDLAVNLPMNWGKYWPSAGGKMADGGLTNRPLVSCTICRHCRSAYKDVGFAGIVVRSRVGFHSMSALSICSGPTVPDHNSPAHPMEEGLPPGLLSSEVLNEV